MLQEMGYASRRYPTLDAGDLIKMGTSVPAQIARVDTSIGDLTVGKKADFVVIRAKPDPNARNPVLDPVLKATPADVLLVVVGGEPLYGDPELMKQLRPADKLEDLTVCGAPKRLYLGESDATALQNKTLAQIESALNTCPCRKPNPAGT